MKHGSNFFKDAGPVILRLEQRSASWSRLSAADFRTWVLRLGVAAVVVGLLVWGRVRVLANGYQIAGLKARRDTLLSEQHQLQRQLDTMQSLHYAELEARKRLGMVDINPNKVIHLRQPTATERILHGISAFFGGGHSSQSGSGAAPGSAVDAPAQGGK